MYWDISKTLSYNALFNFIVGNRGGGKTYGAKKYGIDRFLKTGKQFVYVRRYKTELLKISKFFDNIKDIYEGHKFEVKGKVFYIDDKVAGYAIALSTAKTEKSTAFPDVDTIIFDEFIIETGVYHYLKSEVKEFLDLYETIARLRDVKVFFLSNAISIINPYFLYFDIKLPYGKNFYYKNDMLIEMVNNKEFIEVKKNTRFGKIIDGTDYGSYNIENTFLLDDTETFISKKTGNCSMIFKVLNNGIIYGVWYSTERKKFWVSFDYEKDGDLYCFNFNEHTEDTILILSKSQISIVKVFIESYKKSMVNFECFKIKGIFEKIFARMY